jgi:putative ABC transport system permease protein
MNGSVIRLLLQRFSLRHARLAPRASCLLVGILALGVAVFVSIRLANRAAVSSFTHFTDTLTGQSDLIVQAPAGTLPESVLPELRAALGARPVYIVPVVEATAAEAFAAGEAAGFGRKTFTLLGVDLLRIGAGGRNDVYSHRLQELAVVPLPLSAAHRGHQPDLRV